MEDKHIKEIKGLLPDSQISEVKPCTTEGKCQIHMRVTAANLDVLTKIIDVKKFCSVLKESQKFQDVKCSAELGLIKATVDEAELSVLASGRIVIKNADNVKEAYEILAELAHLLDESKSFLPLVDKKSP